MDLLGRAARKAFQDARDSIEVVVGKARIAKQSTGRFVAERAQEEKDEEAESRSTPRTTLQALNTLNQRLGLWG